MSEVEKLTKETKTLILLVGLPYSGKSTWAKKQPHPTVNPDAIRVALHGQRFIGEAEPYVWAIAKTMVKSLFLCGHDTVILDATNTTEERRKAWDSSKWSVETHYFNASEAECLGRAADANDHEIEPIIVKMAEQFEIPEGCDNAVG